MRLTYPTVQAVAIVTYVALLSSGFANGGEANPNAHLSADQIIEKCGYNVETHYVITDDGYNLTVFRIPQNKNNENATKGPVIVQHGFFCSANDWVLNPCDNSLPLQLADEGYDVFLTNIRGNNYSANNPTTNGLTPDMVQYWNFSFHEMGVHDVPAFIDFALDLTESDQLFWIGHSMGTTMFYICMSEFPEYNSKIKGMFSLAPVAFGGNLTSPALRIIAPLGYYDAFYNIETALGQGQVVPPELLGLFQFLLPGFCVGLTDKLICSNVMFFIGGYDPDQQSPGENSNIVGHTPSNSSVKTLQHFLQNINKPATFTQFDYGRKGNLIAYNQIKPPPYNLSAITAPIYLYWGHHDTLATPKDVALLNSRLPAGTVKAYEPVPFSYWNHLDFTYAKDARKLLYNTVVAKMNAV